MTNNNNQTMDTSDDVYRNANMAPILPCKLNKPKPEHKSPMKINMRRRLHMIPVKSTSVELLSAILGWDWGNFGSEISHSLGFSWHAIVWSKLANLRSASLLNFSNLETVTKDHKCKIFWKHFNRLLALKTRVKVSVVAIMTWSGWMINVTGTTEMHAEWETLPK